MTKNLLRKAIYNNLTSLFTEEGIYASGKEEVYGCIFGRDSAITILKILKVCSNRSKAFDVGEVELLATCRRSLLTLSDLQGKDVNYQSGEEPGKFIHEYRTTNLDRLLKREDPWYVYPDGSIKNYDSIDSTPLGLLAIHKYWRATEDLEFLYTILPTVEKGLNWIMNFGDMDGDYLLEYEVNINRVHGGLRVHSWTDSEDSLRQINGELPYYPIAPVEVQGYAWLALELWGNFFKKYPEFSREQDFHLKLTDFANNLKKNFNKKFIIRDNGFYYAAQVLDGHKNQIKTITGNPLLLLWASYKKNGIPHSIISKKYINDFVSRAMQSDLFDKRAGVRTMSQMSATYNAGPNSYHNGSFWPKLNGMVYEGLSIWGYKKEARLLKSATLGPIRHFGSPIELYVRDEEGHFQEFKGDDGQVSCRNQAWSAAIALDLLTERRVK